MLLTYFLNNFEMVPVAPIITGITFVFTFHMRCISIVRSLYFRIYYYYGIYYYYCCCCCCCCCCVVHCHTPLLLGPSPPNQQQSPPLNLPVSDCSTFRIVCDVPSVA